MSNKYIAWMESCRREIEAERAESETVGMLISQIAVDRLRRQ